MVKFIMNKINFLYILLFFSLLFIYSIINLQVSNKNLAQMQVKNKQYLEIAEYYHSLQLAWGKDKKIKNKIEHILLLSKIDNVSIITNAKVMKIKIINSNVKSLHKFMNKLLNKTIVISKFSLTKSSLDLEIEL